MHKVDGRKSQLVALLTTFLLSSCATTTHWVDATGQFRSDGLLQQNLFECRQLEMAVEQQYENKLKPSVASASNENQAAFILLAVEADALVAGKSQFGMCMARSGWVERKIDRTPSSPVNTSEVMTSQSNSAVATESQMSNSLPLANLSESATQEGFITIRDIHIAPKEWREYPPRKVPDTLTIIDDHLSIYSNGSIFAKVMMNYDRPSKLLFIGTTQSVLFDVEIRCDSDKGMAREVAFYSGRNATGKLLKEALSVPIHIKPNSVESQMQSYVCSTIASR